MWFQRLSLGLFFGLSLGLFLRCWVQCGPAPRRAVALIFAAALAAALGMGADQARAQADAEAPEPELSEEQQVAAEARRAAAEAVATIQNILGTITEKQAEAEILRGEIEAAETDVDREAANESLIALNRELNELNAQVEALATGVSVEDLSRGEEAFDLQGELEQLIQPFILMLKSATENARAIENLKRAQLLAEREKATADNALASLEPIVEQAPPESETLSRLEELAGQWRERSDQAKDRAAAASRQLESRLAAQNDPAKTTGAAFQSFFSERGRNLAMGIGAFALVFFVLRMIRSGALRLIGAPRNRSVPARVGAFIFDGLTILAAFGAMLSIFNMFNDWLLTGLTILLLIALGWFVLRSAPSLVEQITLLLNLGAVQEGERVMMDGVPWRVKRLDFYTDLENPALRGGSFTVPIRELSGLHSRPMDQREVWFPSEEGDVVILGDERWGEVVFQSPELVQIREEGGAVITFTLPAYLDQNPTNLSRGFEATTVIGVDYRHQADATDAIPRTLAAYVKARLEDKFDPDWLRSVTAEMIAAGDSALDIEITAEMTGAAAPRYDDIRHALARFAVECCSANRWSIPFPTMTLTRG